MVRIGFIVEGESEKVLLDSDLFRGFAKNIGVEVVDPVIDAGGSGNLLPNNIDVYLRRLEKESVSLIVVLTDLEN